MTLPLSYETGWSKPVEKGNSMQKEKTMLFRGSKDRLKRNISRVGGTVLENQRFEIVWRSKCFRRGLAYRFRCRYEKAEEGYRITYTFRPTGITVLWMGLLMGYLQTFVVLEGISGNYESAAAVGVFSLLYPFLAIWQGRSCHKEFLSFFQVVTG